jgi:hypothetical protein
MYVWLRKQCCPRLRHASHDTTENGENHVIVLKSLYIICQIMRVIIGTLGIVVEQ